MPRDKLIEDFFQLDTSVAGTSRVREFLRKNSHDPDFKEFTNGLLLRMIDDNYMEVVEALVEFGADVNAHTLMVPRRSISPSGQGIEA